MSQCAMVGLVLVQEGKCFDKVRGKVATTMKTKVTQLLLSPQPQATASLARWGCALPLITGLLSESQPW